MLPWPVTHWVQLALPPTTSRVSTTTWDSPGLTIQVIPAELTKSYIDS